MTEEEILEHNKNVFDSIKYNKDDIEKLKILNNVLINNIVAPCDYCIIPKNFFRCEACEKGNYVGFNIENFSQWK